MGIVIGAAAVLAATLLIFAYLVFIWWLDRYEREPFWLVLATFAYGGIFGTMFGCILSAMPNDLAMALFGPAAGDFVGGVFVAPVVEEFTKGLVFAVLVLSKHFDNETDGLIYGAAVGLGFACVENLAYFAGAQSLDGLIGLAVVRTLFTAIVHCVSSATLGMAVGLARRRAPLVGFLVVTVGYLLAVTNHATWNGLATIAGFGSMQESGLSIVVSLAGCALVALAAFVMFGLTQLSLNREHNVIKRHLAVEAARGTIPAAHVEIIPYWLRRRAGDWLPASVAREEYIEAATLLAFRQHQLERAEGADRVAILEDIDGYRARLAKLLA